MQPMFTGIIQSVGKVKEVTKEKLVLEASDIASEVKLGSSVSVNGCCLTVTASEDGLSFDFMPETAAKTNIGMLHPGDEVNLELAMAASDRFDGHIVSGHVEALGEVIDIQEKENSTIFTISIPEDLVKYVVEKGSITINGISLTVISIEEDEVSVGIIPHTLENTNLKALNKGDRVNIETDMLAKYVEKLTAK